MEAKLNEVFGRRDDENPDHIMIFYKSDGLTVSRLEKIHPPYPENYSESYNGEYTQGIIFSKSACDDLGIEIEDEY